MATGLPYSPVADWLAITTASAHEGVLLDLVSGRTATLTRTTAKTVYDAATGLIHDVAAGYLAVRPWSNSRAGGVGYEAVIEESRVNKLLDSYFANATIGTNWASDVTLSRSNTVTPPYGTHAALCEYTGAGGDSNATKVLLSQSAAYAATNNVTSSWWIYGAVTGCQLQLYMEALDAGSNVLGTVTANVTPGATWARSTLTYTNLPANTASVRGGLRCTGVDTGDTVAVRASAGQRELGAFATSYIPTTSGTVTRNADVLSISTSGWSYTAGTYVAVVGPTVDVATEAEIMDWRNGAGTNRVNLYYNSSNEVAATRVDGSTTLTKGVSGSWTGGVVAACLWSVGGSLYVVKNGTKSGATGSVAAFADNPGATANLGNATGSAHHLNGPIHRFVSYAAALSDTQLTELNSLINGDTLSTTSAVSTALAALASAIGTPVALDGGAATIAGMLTKLADDSGGSTYDATTDSLTAIRDRGDAEWETATGFAVTGDAMTLTAAYDAAKQAASAASVAAIPTTPLLAANYTAPDNAGIAAILEDTGTTLPAAITGVPDAVRTELATELGHIDEDVSAAKTLTAGERTTLTAAIWGALTSGLTGVGSIGAWLIAQVTAVAAKTALITTGSVIFTGPVPSSGQVEITQGDDYADADDSALTWSDTAWPNLTGATVNIVTDDTTFPCTVTSASSFMREFTNAQTTAMTEGSYDFTITADLATVPVRHRTLLRGIWTVTPGA